jgi:phosphoenolpyruvate carboxykinase (ATP)
VPLHCPYVPDRVLDQRNSWANPGDYDAQAAKLARMFAANFQQFDSKTTVEIRAAGPYIG